MRESGVKIRCMAKERCVTTKAQCTKAFGSMATESTSKEYTAVQMVSNYRRQSTD